MDGRPKRWEGTHLYTKETPGRKARTASLVRLEAAAKLKEERDRRKQEAEERRRSLSVGSLSTTMPGPRPRKSNGTGAGASKIGLPSPAATAAGTENQDKQDSNQDNPESGETPVHSTDSATPMADDEVVELDGPPGGVDPSMAAFFYAMETRMKESAKKSADDLSNLFKRNIERIDGNTKAIAELKKNDEQLEARMLAAIEGGEARAIEREEKMEKRITAALSKKMDEAANSTSLSARTAVASVALQPLSEAQQGRREAAYHHCRRSLKAWPVEGDDLCDSFKTFMSQRLRLTDPVIAALGPITVSKRPGKVAAQKLEVLVVFDSKEDRDLVKAAGVNLAGQSNVGLLLHVPGHLLDNLHALNNVGYYIKQNNEGVRRNVKFDDENLDIFMDIKIGESWRKITPAEAKQAAAAMPKEDRSSRNLSVEDLSALVQGMPVAGVNAVVVPADKE